MEVHKNAICKKITIGMLIITTIIISIVPAFAEQTLQPVPDFSEWAKGTLNEGERLGIYPLTWYYDGFREAISEEKLNELTAKIEVKFAALSLEVNEDFQPIEIKGNSRQAVLMALYNKLAKYNLPSDFELLTLKPIDYFVKRGILKGSSSGLELNRECSVQEAVIIATRLVFDTYDTLEAGAKGFLWKTTKNGNTVYMLGSVHLGSSTVYPINKEVRKAYNSCDTLVVEANILNQQAIMGEFVQRAMYTDGTSLQDHVSEDTYNKCLTVFEQLSLPVEVMTRFKPWSIANDLGVLASTNSESLQDTAQATNAGIDMYFLSKALLDQKPIQELEGIVFQADLFNGLSAETQENYLNQALENILNPPEEENSSSNALNAWLEMWRQGNVTEFKDSYQVTIEEDSTEISKMLFGKRDEGMTEKISTMLEAEGSQTYFVVVGAGHLTVNNSVIDRLIEMGYEVELVE